MESKTKQIKRRQRRVTDSDEEGITGTMVSEPRVVLTPVKGRSRDSSVSLSTEDYPPMWKTATKCAKTTEANRASEKGTEAYGDGCLAAVAEERKDLERFRFEESNKINRPAIRVILEKWASMESRFQTTLMENKASKEMTKNVGKLRLEAPTYA